MKSISLFRGAVCAALIAAASTARAGYIDHFATSADIGPDKAPSHGVSSILVIPVIVDDVSLPSEEELLAELEPFYDNLADGLTFGNYYRIASLGRFSPLVTLAPAVHYASCPFSSADCSIPRGDPLTLLPALKVIKQVLDATDAAVDFSDHDVNGIVPGVADGYIDGLMLVANFSSGGIALPHRRICDKLGLACLPYVGSWNETYDGVIVPWAAISGVRDGQIDRAGYVSIHEFGHLLGWADLYDESGNTTSLPYSVMGGWYYDATPQLPDAFSRYVIGWSNPVQIAGSGTATLRRAHTYGDVVKLGTGNEYFLVENRGPLDMWDGDITPGLVVQHVKLDERPGPGDQSYLNTIASCVNCETWSPMLMVEQADGLYEHQAASGNRDDPGDMFRTGDTFPSAASHAPLSGMSKAFDSNRYDGSSTGIAITAVDTDTLGEVATVTVVHPTVVDPCADLLCPSGTSCDAGACAEPVGDPDAGPTEPDGGPVGGDAASMSGDDTMGAGDTSGGPPGGDAMTSGGGPGSGSNAGSPDRGCTQTTTPAWVGFGLLLLVGRRRRR